MATIDNGQYPIGYITSSPLFMIGYNHYTKFIKMPTYKVNQKDEYIERTDANGKVHRDIYRTKISGTFTLMFTDIKDYQQFMNDIRIAKSNEGYIYCTLYVNNISARAYGQFYIEMDPANELPYYGSKQVSGFEVTVTEV